ncbi:sugar dehydrogenase complex small subunit [Marinobacterium lutimaris]|uniref:Membrane bound FAD containing D-sorbitol dehydrogenase n=1 Tax=Marinobacterium lutimaris TaxID=568106 RepID=A0A1H6D9J6_9GAMM|nr:sugar dehydrogenase complex small subunit [Marinobacterium lutimaris]SEG81493.1 Membrane bound FAD containing D-sorbitol dehydrogenase [Marinobacterium lutimaris]
MNSNHSKTGVTRRGFLAASLAAGSLTLIPHALASTTPASVADSDAYRAFIAVSQQITANTALKPAMAERLYLALVRHDDSFAGRIKQLDRFITDQAVAVSELQARVEAEAPELKDLPPAIATGWFEGLVGSGKDLELIAFSEALMYVAVADVLKPPSYSLGEYGIWQSKPAKA